MHTEVPFASVPGQNFAINTFSVVAYVNREVFLAIPDFYFDLMGPGMLERVS